MTPARPTIPRLRRYLVRVSLISLALLTGCPPDNTPLIEENERLKKQIVKQESLMTTLQEGNRVLQGTDRPAQPGISEERGRVCATTRARATNRPGPLHGKTKPASTSRGLNQQKPETAAGHPKTAQAARTRATNRPGPLDGKTKPVSTNRGLDARKPETASGRSKIQERRPVAAQATGARPASPASQQPGGQGARAVTQTAGRDQGRHAGPGEQWIHVDGENGNRPESGVDHGTKNLTLALDRVARIPETSTWWNWKLNPTTGPP